MATVKTYKLNSGHEMPMVGLGTWKSKAGEVEAAVKTALEHGYRHVDCAAAYGNEAEVGAALTEVLAGGKIKREELFICSKLWNTSHRADLVKPALEESLRLLGLKYLDLYLIHWPMAWKSGADKFPRDADGNLIYEYVNPLDTWKAMEACVDAGLVRSIGVSNFNSGQMQKLLEHATIKPTVNQVELHPYFSNAKLMEFCLERGVAVTAFSPLGSPDRPWAPPEEPALVDDPKLKAIAAKYNKTPAQVVMRWIIQKNVLVIPKSVTPSRIRENFAVFDFELSDEDMEVVDGFDRNIRLVVPTIEVDGKRIYRDRKAPEFPFNIEF